MNDAIVTNTTINTMVAQVSVGLSEIDNSEISIRPNPVSSIVFISEKDQKSIGKVLIYNQLGQLVLSEKSNKIDISHLPKGFYTMEIAVGKGIAIEKLVIQ